MVGTRKQRGPIRRFLSILGPGVVTGAADDDPSGIATYSIAGAQLGTSLLWTAFLTWPLMAAVQMACARIGMVTGAGLADALRKKFPRFVLIAVALSLFGANTINIAADLSGMADAAEMLSGLNSHYFVVVFGAALAVATIRLRYRQIAGALKWLALVLFAYVITAIVVGPDWSVVLRDAILPSLPRGREAWGTLVAILGTTISPYLFFWQAEEEVEEEQEKPEKSPLLEAPRQAPGEFYRIRIDTYAGMALSNLVALFIVITTAATLHAHGVNDIQTSAQAAEALRPIAGPFAFVLFAAGIIGTGLLALPVLAGSAAYALGEAMRWQVGLAKQAGRAPAFYAAIALATIVGAALNFSPIDPIKALFWSAVINGIVAVPVMVIMMMLTRRRDVMGDFVLPPILRILGWLATAVMAATVVALAVSSLT